MKNLKLPLLTLFLLSVLWTACFKDAYTGIGAESTATVVFAGRILDEANQPVVGAQVRAGGELAITDNNGVFRLDPVQLPASNAILKVNKIGYFDFSRAYMVKGNSMQNLTIQLLQKVQVGSFAAGSGGTVNVPGGASIVFPAGSVSYSGQVRVFARYLDPTDAKLPLFMPGDLRGVNLGGEEQTLSTFGMLAVELRGQANEELQLASGQEAEVSMPVAASQSSVAPATIPLWHYDNDQARWIEEGSAQKTGNQYVGKVKHFSFWNCDIGWPLIRLDGQVLINPNNTPLSGAIVRLTVLSKGYQGYAMTDASGQFGGAVLINEVMLLEVFAPTLCGNTPIFSQTVGPFSVPTVLPNIQITLPAQILLTEVSGRLLDCAQQPVANGYVLVETDNIGTFAGFADAAGLFNLSFLDCSSGPQTGTAIGYNVLDVKESALQSFALPAATVALGDIAVCQTLSEFIQYDLNGESFTVIKPEGFLEIDRTSISAIDSLQDKGSIIFTFQNNGQTGTFPLLFLTVQKHWQDSILNVQVNTTVTEYGAANQHIVGTFNGTYQTATNGAAHNIVGSYRVRRKF